MADYSSFEHLLVGVNDGVALVTINRPEVLNATNGRLHWELTQIWSAVDADPEACVAVITGAGRAFSVGGDQKWLGGVATMEKAERFQTVSGLMKEASDVVYNIINCEKPVVSAINGFAVGAGLAVALCADITIISETARFTDGHIKLGVAAGDHAAIIWPLLCGMAKAKLYLLTADFIDGKEAERIGLVSRAVPEDQVLPVAMEYARKLADGPQHAIRFTKRALNQWLRLGGVTSFDTSLAYEMLGFMSSDFDEGINSLNEKRQPNFPSAQSPSGRSWA
ncbi:MAG TPA: enoyl-CoA hydratase/isomerase family protein [Dehalococcoidia bacterium]|nr:enoyl-CoA hydratase/isomerase family protein [Dehalococcoidia bacterium]